MFIVFAGFYMISMVLGEFGFRVSGFGLRVPDFGFRVSGLGFA